MARVLATGADTVSAMPAIAYTALARLAQARQGVVAHGIQHAAFGHIGRFAPILSQGALSFACGRGAAQSCSQGSCSRTFTSRFPVGFVVRVAALEAVAAHHSTGGRCSLCPMALDGATACGLEVPVSELGHVRHELVCHRFGFLGVAIIGCQSCLVTSARNLSGDASLLDMDRSSAVFMSGATPNFTMALASFTSAGAFLST